MRRSITPLSTALPAAALLLALAVAPVRAEPCTITGPAAWCGTGAVELCGPTGDWAYEWTGPEGFASGDRCISVSVPGTYTLIAYNPWMGSMLDPCSYELAVAPPPTATIDGPTSACTGTTARLCGPFGNYGWSWTAPDGAQLATQCVDAALAGTWSLIVTDLSSGCVSDPATHLLAFTSCDTAAPPPPPPPPLDQPVACPRTASWWAQQCRARGAAHVLDAAALAQVAACADAHAAAFAWDDPAAGLCRTLAYRPGQDLRARTLRQFAAVLANVCGGNLALEIGRGVRVGLDASTPLTLDGMPPTVGAWIVDADARLVAVQGRSMRDKEATRTLRAILRTAWNINHGVGLGVTVCDQKRDSGMGEEQDAAADDRDLTLAMNDNGGALSLAPPTPNPFRTGTSVEFLVDADSDQEVVVTVHDLSGRVVSELARGMWSPGAHTLSWDGTDRTGRRVPAGVYFVMGSIGGQRVQSRVTMLR